MARTVRDKTLERQEATFASRRKRVLRQIRGEALVIAASPRVTSSRDQHFSFRQDSNFYYLTGLLEADAVLVLLGLLRGPRSVLFVRERDAAKERWNGPEYLGLRKAKRLLQVDEVRDIATFSRDLPQLLKETQTLHFTPGTNPELDQSIWSGFRSHLNPRADFPQTLRDARVLLAEMRAVKDREEIRTLRHAIDITAHGLIELAPQLPHLANERHAAQVLETTFSLLGSEQPAFPSIIASGRNAVVLHHRPLLHPLWKKEMVLIDAGALFRGYAGDISRVFPVSGHFTPAQADIYDIVHNALRSTISRLHPGMTFEAMQHSAVEALVRGMIELKILRGSVSDNIRSEKYKRFFPHRIGHHLGLDVHDITPLHSPRPNFTTSGWTRPFVAGNVFTVEPGLYLDPKDETVPKRFRGIGVRLEEDVLITESGCEVLSTRVPISRESIEILMTT